MAQPNAPWCENTETWSEKSVFSTVHIFRLFDMFCNILFFNLGNEAISRMFEKGLNVSEVASISGHKTASQLFRYVQINGIL